MSAPIYRGGAPFIAPGLRTKYRTFASASAAVTLTKSNSMATYLFDQAAGVVYTLPTAVPGLMFTFVVTVSATSNGHKIIVKNTTSEFLIGELTGYNTASADAALGFHGDGSTHVSVNQTATGSNAKGGLQGGIIECWCVTTGLWAVQGQFLSGTTATTPFATS